MCNLLPRGVDFLLGAEGALFKDLQDLVELIAQYVNKCISMYVYNVTTDSIRVVPIVPSNVWGGRGLLGCEFGRPVFLYEKRNLFSYQHRSCMSCYCLHIFSF